MNSVVLIGQLTRDPELRRIPESQNAVATFTLAVDRPVAKERKAADFIRIVVYGKQAENCGRFLVKGRKAGIQGRIQTGSYDGRDGNRVHTTDVIAERVEFLEWGDPKESRGDPGVPEGFHEVGDDDDVPF
jgi:single-strand DNA-binding protein